MVNAKCIKITVAFYFFLYICICTYICIVEGGGGREEVANTEILLIDEKKTNRKNGFNLHLLAFKIPHPSVFPLLLNPSLSLSRPLPFPRKLFNNFFFLVVSCFECWATPDNINNPAPPPAHHRSPLSPPHHGLYAHLFLY